MTCSYDERGAAGPLDNTLTVGLNASADNAIIARKGDVIEIRDAEYPFRSFAVNGLIEPTPVGCAGGTPTVANTDTIHITAGPISPAGVRVDLTGGPLAPGVAEEADAASEIEIVGSLPFEQPDEEQPTGPGVPAPQGEPAGILFVTGSGGPDVIRLGRTDQPGHTGTNLNADEESPDVDIDLEGVGIAGVFGVEGDDLLGAGGGTGLASAYDGPLILYGGDGNDSLLGGPGGDYLDGGHGVDSIAAADGNDYLVGGRRPDTVEADSGRDQIRVRRGGRDTVRCGSGRDRGLADRRDQLFSCGDVELG